jgi:hypothetical protein
VALCDFENAIVKKNEELPHRRCTLSMTRILARAIFVAILVAAALVCESGSSHIEAANAVKSGPSSKVILEVINRHFTVGKKIPSIYLRVFSDGSAECHAEKYWDETDTAKKKALSQKDFEQLKVLVGQPELLNVKPRYELMEPVIDSWMEWTIKVPHGRNVQKIEVANFAPAAAKERKEPYPDVLVKLGCSIWKLRSYVYSDGVAAGKANRADCNAALGVQRLSNDAAP